MLKMFIHAYTYTFFCTPDILLQEEEDIEERAASERKKKEAEYTMLEGKC